MSHKEFLPPTTCKSCQARIEAGHFFCRTCGRSRWSLLKLHIKLWELVLLGSLGFCLVTVCSVPILANLFLSFIPSRYFESTLIPTTYSTSTPIKTLEPTQTNTKIPTPQPTRTRVYTSTPPKISTKTPTKTRSPSKQEAILINGIEYLAWQYCSNTKMSIIQKGDFAYVNPVPPLRNNIREGPQKGSTIIGQIPYGKGYKMRIMDGPNCSDDWVWWYVKYKNYYGWTAEGDAYWLLPYLEER